MAGWQWMFVITGLIGIFIALATWLWLPGFPNEARFLTERERAFVVARLSGNAPRSTDANLDLRAISRMLRDPRLWLFTAMQLFERTSTTGLNFWLPTIIASFGFTTTQSSQLLNIPPAAIGIVSGVIFAYFSDRLTHIPRPSWMLGSQLVLIGSFVTLALVKNNGALYAMTLVAGIATNVFWAVLFPWRAQSLRGSSEAAFGFAFQNGLAQIGAIIGPQIFRARFAPRYTQAFAICLAFQGAAFVVVALGWWVTRALERETREVTRARRKEERETGAVSGRQVVLG